MEGRQERQATEWTRRQLQPRNRRDEVRNHIQPNEPQLWLLRYRIEKKKQKKFVLGLDN